MTAAANRYAAAVKWTSAALIVASLLLIARQVPLDVAIRALEDWVGRLGAWGPVVFGLIYALVAVAPVPVWPLTVTAGAIFGPAFGAVTASLALTAGAALAFLMVRYAARDAVASRLRRHPKFEAIDRAIGQDGWKIVAVIRLSPVLPFAAQNYLYGVTRIRFWPYVLASWVAMLPGTMLYVYLGHAGRAGLEAAARPAGARTPAEWAIIGFGLLATVAATVAITRLARRAMEEQAHIAEAEVVELNELVLAEPAPARPEGWPW
ncbi:MAG TPA: TVP38/TMEM64 family protein, partial [Isosphaeraceae bacterium]|nr:TVP38/TMEM64 family protein [Isosphaeraceae bacterium]